MGTLDDDPGIRPTLHVFVGSKGTIFWAASAKCEQGLAAPHADGLIIQYLFGLS
jgi:hypothetical protein